MNTKVALVTIKIQAENADQLIAGILRATKEFSRPDEKVTVRGEP